MFLKSKRHREQFRIDRRSFSDYDSYVDARSAGRKKGIVFHAEISESRLSTTAPANFAAFMRSEKPVTALLDAGAAGASCTGATGGTAGAAAADHFTIQRAMQGAHD